MDNLKPPRHPADLDALAQRIARLEKGSVCFDQNHDHDEDSLVVHAPRGRNYTVWAVDEVETSPGVTIMSVTMVEAMWPSGEGSS